MLDATAIVFEDNGHKGRYVMRNPGGEEALMTVTTVGAHQLIIDHTEVPEALRGTGVGTLLVERAVQDARRDGKTIIPLCPFAAAQFRRHPDWSDVLAS